MKNIKRQFIPDISFVNAHSERDRGHDDWNLAIHPFLLHFIASQKKDCDLGKDSSKLIEGTILKKRNERK